MKLKSIKPYDSYANGTKKVKDKGDDKDKLGGRSGQVSTNVKSTGDETEKERVQKAAGIKGNSPLKPGQKGYDEALKERTMKLKNYSKQNIEERAGATAKAKSQMDASSTVKQSTAGAKDTQTAKTKSYVDKAQAREKELSDEDKKKTTKKPAVKAYNSKADGAKKMKLKMGNKSC